MIGRLASRGSRLPGAVRRSPRSLPTRAEASAREDLNDRRRFVGALRDQLAQVCMSALEPDLIILDEFQRFKHLLRTDEPAGELAQQLFGFRDHRGERCPRPSALGDAVQDVHARRGGRRRPLRRSRRHAALPLRRPGRDRAVRARSSSAYRERSSASTPAHLERAVALKEQLESKLRASWCAPSGSRPRRIETGCSLSADPDGVALETGELESFSALDGLARALDAGDVLEYWKSAPYLLDFMDDYKLVRSFERAGRSERPKRFASCCATSAAPLGRRRALPQARSREPAAAQPDHRGARHGGVAPALDSAVAPVLRARRAV